MVRAPYFDKNGTKKGAWSKEEDDKLRAYVEKYGHRNWSKLPKLAGLSRCGKSCRLRWMNYLRPNIKLGNYTNEEEDLIINLHNNLGNKWSAIAANLPGRSDNDIKNHWHMHLKERAKQKNSISYPGSANVKNPECNKENCIIKFAGLSEKDEVNILVAVLSSESSSDAHKGPSSSSGAIHVASNVVSLQLSNDELGGDFWTEPFFQDTCSGLSDEHLKTPVDLINRYETSSSRHGMIMVDDFLLSTIEFCGL